MVVGAGPDWSQELFLAIPLGCSPLVLSQAHLLGQRWSTWDVDWHLQDGMLVLRASTAVCYVAALAPPRAPAAEADLRRDSDCTTFPLLTWSPAGVQLCLFTSQRWWNPYLIITYSLFLWLLYLNSVTHLEVDEEMVWCKDSNLPTQKYFINIIPVTG